MKVRLGIPFVLCLFLFSTYINAGIPNGETVFRQDSIHIIRLTFTQPHFWDTLIARYEAAHDVNSMDVEDNAEPLLASIEIDGKQLDSVGVKLKSNLSYSIPTDKKPMKIYFNGFVKGKKFDGLLRLNLSNEFPDPSLLRNTVAYKIFRDAGVRAPRTAFAKVYVNNNYKGLYVMIEQVDKSFFTHHFDYNSGELIKGLAGFLNWFPNDTFSLKRNYEIKRSNSDEAWKRFVDFTKKINTTPAEDFYDSLKNDFDFDSYVSVFAADIIFNNWDSYFYGQNYYVYRDSSQGKYYYLPWDYNVALNNYDMVGQDYTILPGGANDDLFELPLPIKIINNAFLKEKYLDAVKRINQHMSIDSLETFIRRMHHMIYPALKSDSGKAMTMAQFNQSLNERVAISEFDFEGLLSFIRYRHLQVEEMLMEAQKKKK